MSETPDPIIAVARISDDLADLSARLTEVSDDVAELASALVVEHLEEPAEAPAPSPETPDPGETVETPIRLDPPTEQVPPPRPVPPKNRPVGSPSQPPSQPQPQPQPQPHVQYATTPQGPVPAQFSGTRFPNPPKFPPAPHSPDAQFPGTRFPLPPSRPAPSTRERLTVASEGGLIGKILAFAGVAITLIGVVLLLVLAAQAGLLRPEFRVAGGVLLAIALVGVGVRLGRDPGKRVGAAAIVATGIAAALFSVLAAANVYHWLPVIAALVLTGVITAAGFLIAARWENQALGVTVGLGLIVFSPFLSHGISLTLVSFLLVYAAATLAVQVGRDWLGLFIVNTIATVLPLVLLAAGAATVPADQFIAVLAVTFALAAGSALLLLRTSSAPIVVALFAMVPLIPLLAGAPVLGTTTTAVMLGGAAVILGAMALAGVAVPGAGVGVQTVWLTGTVVAGVAAIGVAGRADGFTLATLGAALLLGLAAYYGRELTQALVVLGTISLGLGLLTLSRPSVIALLHPDGLDQSGRIVLVTGSLLALGAVAALVWAWLQSQRDLAPHGLVVGAGVLGLALFNVLCVAAGALATDGGVTGFRAGHMCATIGFVAAGAAALMWARKLQGAARTLTLAAGLVVLGVAVAKLFLFDLSALAGVFRVIAFIVVGLVLLGLGVAYAQTLSSTDSTDDDPATGPIPVPVPGQGPVAPANHR